MNPAELLAEIEDILRSIPPRETIRHENEENLAWVGRAAAAMEAWDTTKGGMFQVYLQTFHGISARSANAAFRKMLALLHQARHDLRMKTAGPISSAVNAGQVYDYFEELRIIIAGATQDILFIDPYLDADFVARYIPQIQTGVTIRLLGRERMNTLLPAVDAYANQTGTGIQVRRAKGFHDRYVLVDGAACYQSGASFKDGARTAPTTITQITDAFAAMHQTYEDFWANATVER